MAFGVALIVLELLVLGWLIAVGFLGSTPPRAPQSTAQPRPVAVTSPYRPPVPPSDGERLIALELARLGEVRRAAEARLREVGR